MHTIFKILFLLIALELVALAFFAYRKRRLVKNDKKTSLPRLSKLAGFIKKHRIVTTCIILFTLIYPTTLFVYIKIFMIVSWISLIALWPCLILLVKREKLSLKTVLGIFTACLFIPLLLWFLNIFFHFSPRIYNILRTDFIRLHLGMSLFYFLALLSMLLFKQKNFCWWINLLMINTTGILIFSIINTTIYYNTHNLTNIRSESECITLKGKKVKDNDGGQCWERYSWVHGLCVKSEGVSCIGPIGRAFQ